MSKDTDQSLFDLGQHVLWHFDGLHRAFGQADLNVIAGLDATDVAETNDRFWIWASNIGLFNPAHTSLDYRLRDNKVIKKFTVDSLHNIGEKINQLNQIVLGERVPFDLLESDDEQDLQSPGTDEPAVLDTGDCNSDESDMQIVVGGLSTIQNQTEAALLFEQLCTKIDQLFHLAVQIRSPSTRKVPAVNKVDLFKYISDNKYISDKFKDEFVSLSKNREEEGLIQVFEQCRKEVRGNGRDDNVRSEQNQPDEHQSLSEGDKILILRLRKANHVRRCYFEYWKRYKSKATKFTSKATKNAPFLGSALSHSQITSSSPRDQAATSSASPSHPSSSNLTSEMPLAPDFVLKGGSSSKSSRLRTVSVKGEDGLTVHWPLPPSKAQRKITDFECPYCFFICPRATLLEQTWRDHLRRDLQPYVCTYLDCDNADELYYDYDSWNMHEQRTHRRIWVCKVDKEPFQEQGLYEQHVRSLHPALAEKLLTPELIISRESTTKLCDRECPICLRDFTQTYDMQHHIARHLENIAFLALPPMDDLESTSGHGSLPSDVAEKHDRQLALSTAGDFPEARGLPPQFPENDDSDSEDLAGLNHRPPLTLQNIAELQKHVQKNPDLSGSLVDRLVLTWRTTVEHEMELLQKQEMLESSAAKHGETVEAGSSDSLSGKHSQGHLERRPPAHAAALLLMVLPLITRSLDGFDNFSSQRRARGVRAFSQALTELYFVIKSSLRQVVDLFDTVEGAETNLIDEYVQMDMKLARSMGVSDTEKYADILWRCVRSIEEMLLRLKHPHLPAHWLTDAVPSEPSPLERQFLGQIDNLEVRATKSTLDDFVARIDDLRQELSTFQGKFNRQLRTIQREVSRRAKQIAAEFVDSQGRAMVLYGAMLKIAEHSDFLSLALLLWTPPNDTIESILPSLSSNLSQHSSSKSIFQLMLSSDNVDMLGNVSIEVHPDELFSMEGLPLSSGSKTVRFKDTYRATRQKNQQTVVDLGSILPRGIQSNAQINLDLRGETLFLTQSAKSRNLLRKSNLIRLYDLLSALGREHGQLPLVPLKQRIRLALRLVVFSGQVIHTPWMTRPLRTETVNLQRTQGDDAALDLDANPLIFIDEPFQTDTIPGDATYSRECLLNLGILLLELWHAVTFESTLNPENRAAIDDNIWLRLGQAMEWHRHSKGELPNSYSEAIQICFTFQAHSTGQLEDERRKVTEIYGSVAEHIDTIVKSFHNDF